MHHQALQSQESSLTHLANQCRAGVPAQPASSSRQLVTLPTEPSTQLDLQPPPVQVLHSDASKQLQDGYSRLEDISQKMATMSNNFLLGQLKKSHSVAPQSLKTRQQEKVQAQTREQKRSLRERIQERIESSERRKKSGTLNRTASRNRVESNSRSRSAVSGKSNKSSQAPRSKSRASDKTKKPPLHQKPPANSRSVINVLKLNSSQLSLLKQQLEHKQAEKPKYNIFKDKKIKIKSKAAKPTLTSSRNSQDHFYNKNIEWLRSKHNFIQQEQVKKDSKELADCRFRPNVSKPQAAQMRAFEREPAP